MDIDLTQRLKNKMASRPRVRGRYNSSEMYGIIIGWTTPEQWFNAPEKPIKDILNMWSGIGMHNQLENLMGAEFSEKKVEFPYKGIILVAKADYLPQHKPEEVWEFKTSDHTLEKAKPWHEYQAKLYTSMFNKQRGMIYQPVQAENGIFLKHIGTVERDDKWFEEELQKLYIFHEKVEKLWKIKNKKVD